MPNKPGPYTRERRAAAQAAGVEEGNEVLPERRQGDPPCRCLWCGHYRCHLPLALCRHCGEELRRMKVGMPPATRREHVH